MKIHDRDSSIQYEGSGNPARKRRYLRKLRQLRDEQARAQRDYDLPGHYCRSTEAPGASDDLAAPVGAGRACVAMLAVWLAVAGVWLVW